MAKTPKRVLYGATLTYVDRQCIIGKSWMMFTMFGLPPEFDLVLEEAAVEARGAPVKVWSRFSLERHRLESPRSVFRSRVCNRPSAWRS